MDFSGYSTITAARCNAHHCVTLSYDTKTFDSGTKIISLTTGIQIRWVSSDLSVLATHPLTPGLAPRQLPASPTPIFTSPAVEIPTVSSTLPQSTVRGIPPLSTVNKIWLGLSFLPLFVAVIVSILVGLGFLPRLAKPGRAAHACGNGAKPKFFLPAVLSFPVLAVLTGIAATAAALLGLATQVLYEHHPTTSYVGSGISQSSLLRRQVPIPPVLCRGNYSTTSLVTVYVEFLFNVTGDFGALC